jgi:hypothetical protein
MQHMESDRVNMQSFVKKVRYCHDYTSVVHMKETYGVR